MNNNICLSDETSSMSNVVGSEFSTGKKTLPTLSSKPTVLPDGDQCRALIAEYGNCLKGII
ncbi:MAG: hypothetical protein RR842_13565, partial [Gordonibacter sp.]|uniref:hypothetical protein n=1 Tax=Gordonibacter sp. TaxID=1968902 RepID=UPI002FCAC3C0